MKYSNFISEHKGKFFAVFDAGIDDNDDEWLDVIVYDSEYELELDEDEGTNKRAIARADVINDRGF